MVNQEGVAFAEIPATGDYRMTRSWHLMARRHVYLGLALLTLVGAVEAGAAEPGGTMAFPPATRIEGSPHERGHAYGVAQRAAIREFLDREIYAAFIGKPSSKQQLLEYAAACGAVVRAECPQVAAEFQGIAEGANITFDELTLINLHEELYHRAELPAGAAKHGHCTAVAVGPSDTRDGHALVGQTWDWMPSVAGMSRVCEWRRTESPSVLAYGFPGMPMGAGLNSAGIALCWTSAALGEKGQSPRVGIPSYMLIAHLLAQPDLDSVTREAQKDKHAGWFTFVMADADGRLLNLEGSPDGIAIDESSTRLVRVGYGTPQMAAVASREQVPLHPRCQHMYSLLTATAGSNNLDQLQQYFAEPAHKINVGRSTIDMMIFDTTARTAYLSRGTSYGLEWRTFTFDQQ